MKKVALVFSLLIATSSVFAKIQPDVRVCGAPARNEQGEIIRSKAVLREFERQYPCPVRSFPGVKPGTCPGWAKDHVVPLSCGGCDSVENLQWMTTEDWRDKSKWERKIYGGKGISKGCP